METFKSVLVYSCNFKKRNRGRLGEDFFRHPHFRKFLFFLALVFSYKAALDLQLYCQESPAQAFSCESWEHILNKTTLDDWFCPMTRYTNHPILREKFHHSQ